MSTRDTVNEFLQRFGEGEAAAIVELFADDVDFLCAGPESVPWIRPRRTAADMEDFFATMSAAFVPEERAVSLSLVLVEEDEAVLMGQVSQRLRSNGVKFSSPFALRLSVIEGKISRYHVYEDSLSIANAVAGEPAEIAVRA